MGSDVCDAAMVTLRFLRRPVMCVAVWAHNDVYMLRVITRVIMAEWAT